QSRRDGGCGGLRRETHSELEGRVARTEEEEKGRPTQEVSTGPWCRWARLFLEAHPGTVKTFVGVLLRCLLGTCFGARLRGLLVKDGGRFQQSRFDRGSLLGRLQQVRLQDHGQRSGEGVREVVRVVVGELVADHPGAPPVLTQVWCQ